MKVEGLNLWFAFGRFVDDEFDGDIINAGCVESLDLGATTRTEQVRGCLGSSFEMKRLGKKSSENTVITCAVQKGTEFSEVIAELQLMDFEEDEFALPHITLSDSQPAEPDAVAGFLHEGNLSAPCAGIFPFFPADAGNGLSWSQFSSVKIVAEDDDEFKIELTLSINGQWVLFTGDEQ